MEIIKRNIHMNRLKCKSNMQMTIDNDINVPDVKPDIKKIICINGEIKIQDIKTMNNRVELKGTLLFHILYEASDSYSCIQHMEGETSFVEQVNMADVKDGDNIHVKWELEGLGADMINSRKISIKAILTLIMSAYEEVYEDVAVDMTDTYNMEMLHKDQKVSELVYNNKDIIRIKDEVSLSSGKDSIQELIYQECTLEDIDMRLVQDKLNVSGTLHIFVLYRGVTGDGISDYEARIQFEKETDAGGCDESMISYVTPTVTGDILVKQDEDKEDRVLDIEAAIGLDIKIYEENNIQLLEDMYSVKDDIEPVNKKMMFEEIIMRNNSSIRVNDRITLPEDSSHILQICNASGNVKIDEERIVDSGIEINGVIEISLLYYCENESCVVDSCTGVIPYSQIINVSGIDENSIYEINTMLSQLSVMVVGNNEVEVKASVNNDVIVFNRHMKTVITDYNIKSRDINSLQNMPGITGYVVSGKDNLWSIAKHFRTTIARIKEINEIDDEVCAGQKLLIIKEI